MKQKVFVRGRETQSIRAVRDYISTEDRNSFSEIGFSEIGFSEPYVSKGANRKEFQVRDMGDGTQFLNKHVWKKG